MIPAFLIPALIGGGLGALTSKKPLQGALMGAGMGAAGGALAPGLLGASGAAESAVPAVFNAAKDSQMANLAMGQGAGLLGSAETFAKTAAPYAMLAQQTGLLNPQPEQPIASPVAMPQAQPSNLPQLSQQIEQGALAQQQADDQRRQRRLSLLGGM